MAQPRPQERSTDVNTSQILKSIASDLTSEVLIETGRTAESIDTVLFGFNPWCPIPNIELKGFLFGVQYVVLERMCLIPLKTWKTPDIQPRLGGFAVGAITSGGAFPSGAVGSRVTQKLQFPSQSAKNLLTVYGKDSSTNIGFTVFRSLGGDTDLLKLESLILFRSVMETRLEKDGPRGIDMTLEALPRFLAGEAPKLLKEVIVNGFDINGDMFKLSKGCQHKGELMIEDIVNSVAAATRRALDENSGILPHTKQDLIAAAKGLRDVKVSEDRLDSWLLTQFPSYSLDTDVERATRANRSVTDAIRESGQDNALTLRELLDMQRQTMDHLHESQEANKLLVARLLKLEKPAA